MGRSALGALGPIAFALATACSTPTEPPPTAPSAPAAALQPPVATSAIAADKLAYSIGINTHVSYFRTAYGTGWSTLVKPAIIGLGVKHLRDAGTVVSDDGWMRVVYGRMQELAQAGAKFDLVMRPADGTTNYQDLPQFGRLLQYAAPAVEAFEGLNEHDLSGRSSWASEIESFQRALYAAVKTDSRTQTMPVIGPTIGHLANAASVSDLSAAMDVGAIHPYPGGLEPTSALARHRTALAPIVGSRPFVASETGYHTTPGWTGSHPAVSERAMAVYTARTPFEYLRAGMRRTYFYELIDEGTTSHREDHFGLLRADGSRKPAYDALRRIITLFKDPGQGFTTGQLSYSVSGGGSVLQQLLFQKRDGRFYLALWQAAPSYDVITGTDLRPPTLSLVLQLQSAASVVKVYGPLTSDSPTITRTGVASLSFYLSDEMLVLEITP